MSARWEGMIASACGNAEAARLECVRLARILDDKGTTRAASGNDASPLEIPMAWATPGMGARASATGKTARDGQYATGMASLVADLNTAVTRLAAASTALGTLATLLQTELT